MQSLIQGSDEDVDQDEERESNQVVNPQRAERQQEQERTSGRYGRRYQPGADPAQPRRQRDGWVECDEREFIAPDRVQLVAGERGGQRGKCGHEIVDEHTYPEGVG